MVLKTQSLTHNVFILRQQPGDNECLLAGLVRTQIPGPRLPANPASDSQSRRVKKVVIIYIFDNFPGGAEGTVLLNLCTREYVSSGKETESWYIWIMAVKFQSIDKN